MEPVSAPPEGTRTRKGKQGPLGHPEVYVLILPAMGIVAEVLANNSRKPLWGYKSLVFAALVLGFLSFIVWAHHMWLTGMGSAVSAFFQTTTLIISIPSVIILSAFFISLWGGSIRFNTPMLFATSTIDRPESRTRLTA